MYLCYGPITRWTSLVFPFQKIRRHRKSVLRMCKTLIELGDRGPYHGLIEALRSLIIVVNPRRIPSDVKKHARRLRSILRGVYSRIKECARNEVPGVAQLLHTEISGHGGLSIFRRLDAAFVAVRVPTLRVVGNSNQRGSARSSRGGSSMQAVQPVQQVQQMQQGQQMQQVQQQQGQRGRGNGRRDMTNITCYNCFQRGHMRNNCPNAGPDSTTDN